MSYERLRPAFTFDAERLEQLKAIVPEAFADGKINWEALRAALGDHVEEDGADAEHFGLFWPGKRAARRRASEPSRGTLIPVPGEGVNEDTTRNVFIEADNLDALKLLQKAYAGRVKMIYIDPPYNTGNDFIYRDDFRETSEDYLRRTGQVDELLRPLTTNPRTGGRFHSTWLNMMYPRLLLARTLLREDGVIFVSIDDNEVHNLRQVMGEVFGEENFVAIFPWRKRTAKSDVPFGVSQDFEWIVCFAASARFLAGTSHSRKYFTSDDYPNDRWRLSDLTTQRTPAERPNSNFDLVDPKTGKVYPVNPKRVWGVTRDTFPEYYRRGKIVFPDDYPFLNTSVPAFRVFESEDIAKAIKKYGTEAAKKAVSTLLPNSVGMSEDGNSEVADLFGEKIFSYPKPVSLLKHLILVTSDENDIILDFFAGSGTVAQAVMEQNASDGGNRQFVLVQLPEATGRTDFSTIAAITAERIRRVGKKLHVVETDRNNDTDTPLDLGFRYYRFAPSNYKAWQDYDGSDPAQLQTLFDRFETPLVDGWQPAHLLTEVMLQLGFPLDSRIEVLLQFTANTVQRVTSDFHAHSLYASFDAAVADETIAALSLKDDDIFVCLDSALTDQTKARLSDVCNLRTI